MIGAAALLSGSLVASGSPPMGWQAALSVGTPISIKVEPVEITGGKLSGLVMRGAWVLRAEDRNFGGFSGLLVFGGQLIAVSDMGWWLSAKLVESNRGLRMSEARLAPMHDAESNGYTKAGGDAEGLALRRGHLAVSFERDHRIMLLKDNGRLGETIQPRSFEQFRSNKGLEALATLPDGRLIAFAERADAGGVPMFLVENDGRVAESRMPRAGKHAVTGADVGPDGRLYLVLRDYSPPFGVSIRVMRYRIGPDGWPLPESAEVLAAFETLSGIDNMEGIALDSSPRGETRIWLISDDNFSFLQRTLLIQLALSS